MSPSDIATLARKYAELHREDMYREPREHATSWHAHDLCRLCGSCILRGETSKHCPRKLSLNQITLLDDGVWGPARNIISFTGGDLACQPEFYARATKEIKELEMHLWVLFETNGYGLTLKNLDLFHDAGIDSYWLDIKAYDEKVHKDLTGASNKRILRLPSEILDRGFILEVSSVYIPGWVESDQLRSIATLLAQVDPEIPYAIIAFMPEHQLSHIPPPNFKQMVEAYEDVRDSGLKNVRLGNVGLFAKTTDDYETLLSIGAV
jgi:pyruvate-formate lyase-activating enzyme